MRMTASWVTALAIVALVAGCGGDDGGGSGGSGEGGGEASRPAPITTASLNKAEYVKRANAICERNGEEQLEAFTAYAEEHADEPEEERIEGGFEEVYFPTAEARAAELRELGAPKGEAKRVEQIVVAFEEAIEAARESGPSGKAFVEKSTRARNLARKYNLQECDI